MPSFFSFRFVFGAGVVGFVVWCVQPLFPPIEVRCGLRSSAPLESSMLNIAAACSFFFHRSRLFNITLGISFCDRNQLAVFSFEREVETNEILNVVSGSDTISEGYLLPRLHKFFAAAVTAVSVRLRNPF